MGAESFHAERRTDLAKLMVAFVRNFVNAIKNCKFVSCGVFVASIAALLWGSADRWIVRVSL